eukprot:CAMPEP_0197823804 /NCGR_PEP_ID=MMETSP1437-20131217/1117_1 /TAXON_ID=49252 ORGANISM="Eucampia antarctica, Strain CCMP1452" /NCGR_SAMPLE_ID=MMETSP1437 /ASSEMBLY_ACC=CAM_ASM_001096 /LENGTH=128 /DNA_ID=CAMNT_0043423147 /DNA_START=98 /DNA_END=484 /DNA_ORIENTATION=+
MTRFLLFLFLSILVRMNAQLSRDFEPEMNKLEETSLDAQRNLRSLEDTLPFNLYGNPNPAEGPWPECEGWSGLKCQEYIDTWVARSVSVDKKNTRTPMVEDNIYDFKNDRVWIQCDSDGNVLQSPIRG